MATLESVLPLSHMQVEPSSTQGVLKPDSTTPDSTTKDLALDPEKHVTIFSLPGDILTNILSFCTTSDTLALVRALPKFRLLRTRVLNQGYMAGLVLRKWKFNVDQIPQSLHEDLKNAGVKVLSLYGPVSAEQLRKIATTCPHVQSLSLQGDTERRLPRISPEGVTDDGIEALSSFTQLTSLQLLNCKDLSSYAGRYLAQLSGLTLLSLSGCKHLTDGVGPGIAQLTNLTSLDLGYCSLLTDAVGAHLAKLTKLTSLSLYDCKLLTDACGPSLSHLKLLSTLSLYNCKQLTRAIVPYIAELGQLTKIDIRACKKLSMGSFRTTSTLRVISSD